MKSFQALAMFSSGSRIRRKSWNEDVFICSDDDKSCLSCVTMEDLSADDWEVVVGLDVCPFCHNMNADQGPRVIHAGGYFVKCSACSASGPFCDSIMDAVTEWNRVSDLCR